MILSDHYYLNSDLKFLLEFATFNSAPSPIFTSMLNVRSSMFDVLMFRINRHQPSQIHHSSYFFYFIPSRFSTSLLILTTGT